MTRLTSLTELRRLLPLTAAGLFLLALTMPVWRITLTAPQYVDPLVVELYAYPRVGGDYAEVQLLNKYVGFYYPDPVYADPNYAVHEGAIEVPEWTLGPVAFVGLAAASVVTAVLPADRIERGLVALLGATLAVFVAMGALIQYRLYQAGHSLDPDAPLSGVEGFTPPLVGSYEIANISGTAWFGPGGYLLVAAILSLLVAVRFRGASATIRDAPALSRETGARVREAITAARARLRRGDADDRSERPPAGEGLESEPPRSPSDGDRP